MNDWLWTTEKKFRQVFSNLNKLEYNNIMVHLQDYRHIHTLTLKPKIRLLYNETTLHWSRIDNRFTCKSVIFCVWITTYRPSRKVCMDRNMCGFWTLLEFRTIGGKCRVLSWIVLRRKCGKAWVTTSEPEN